MKSKVLISSPVLATLGLSVANVDAQRAPTSPRARTALAQTDGEFDLTWNTIDSGGGTFSAGKACSLGGTIG